MADETSHRQDLHEQRAFLALADSLSALIAVIQGEKLLYVNPAGCKLLGHPREHFAGRNFWEFALAEDRERVERRGLARQAGIEQPRSFVEPFRRADGAEVWLDLTVDLICLDETITTLVTGHDVTERKRTEDALRKSEQLFRGLYTQTPTMMWAVGWDGRFREVSNALLAKLGYERHEIIGMDSRDCLTPESRLRLEEQRARNMEARDWWTKDFPLQVRRKDGQLLDIQFSSVPELDEGGVPQGWICVASDLSEINRAQEALRLSEERFRSVFENAAIGKAISSPDLRFQKVNRAFCEMLGYTERELLSMSPADLTHRDDYAENEQLVRRLLNGELSSGRILKRYRHKDGRVIWGDLTLTLMRDGTGQPSYFIAEIVDVNERMHVEELLRDSEARLAEAQRVAHVGSWEYDVAADRSTWSAELYRIFGLDPATFTPSMKDAFARFHADDRPRVEEHVQRAIQAGQPFEFEARFVLDGGEVRVLSSIGRAELDSAGKAVRLKEDITVEDLRLRVRTVIEREMAVVVDQLQRNGIALIQGQARFRDAHTLEVQHEGDALLVHAENILIACGTRPARSPRIPCDGRKILVADQLGDAAELPRRLIVVGAGVIGLEYASMLAALGIEVTLVDQRPTILDFVDQEVIEALCYHLRQLGTTFRLGETVKSVGENAQGLVVAELESGKKIQAEALLYTVGRQANSDTLNLAAAGLAADDRGRIKVDADYRTAVAHIFAAGDVIGFPALASTSMEQGRLASCAMFAGPRSTSAAPLPYGIYTIPEISMVGKTERELTEAKTPYEFGIAKYEELAKGQMVGDRIGLLKLLFDPETRKILGVHAIGEGATEIIHIGQCVMALGGTLEYFRDTVFNYPTFAEAYKVAALDGLNKL